MIVTQAVEEKSLHPADHDIAARPLDAPVILGSEEPSLSRPATEIVRGDRGVKLDLGDSFHDLTKEEPKLRRINNVGQSMQYAGACREFPIPSLRGRKGVRGENCA